MEVHSLATLLQEKRYQECKEAAERLLRRGALPIAERAQVYLALSSSQASLQESQASLGPAEISVHLAKESQEYDLLGRALLHLAELCQENRLYKRALQLVDEYFYYFTLYKLSRGLEGRVFYLAAQSHQALGRGAKALEYFRKAYHWQEQSLQEPHRLEAYRAALIWQLLQQGEAEAASELLPLSEEYLSQSPEDQEAMARYLNNIAFKAYRKAEYIRSADHCLKVLELRGITPIHKAQALLTLHYTTKALGLARESTGLGLIAKMQAAVARRPDIEDQVVRSMLHLQQSEADLRIDDLMQDLGALSRKVKREAMRIV